jgi:hypothetical protein
MVQAPPAPSRRQLLVGIARNVWWKILTPLAVTVGIAATLRQPAMPHLLTALGLGFDIAGVLVFAGAVWLPKDQREHMGTVGWLSWGQQRAAERNRIESIVALALAITGFLLQLIGDLLD